MNIEPSRDPERMAHTWVLPAGMQPRQALEHFEKHVKPKIYTFERWTYNPKTGHMVTV